jgi:hypothetical protein
MVFLIEHRIVWTGNTTLQDLITNALTAERERLEQLVEAATTKEGSQGTGAIVSY